MASSRTGPNYTHRFFWFAVLIVLAIAAYSAGWFWLARQVDARAKTTLSALNRDGMEATCSNRNVRGYPFRIGLYCDAVAFANAAQGVAFSAGEFRSAGQIYDPRFLIGELDGPARLESGNGSPPLELSWEILRASIRIATPLPKRVSVESRDVSVRTIDGAAAAQAATLERVEAHLRPNGPDLDLALRFEGLALDPDLVQGREIPVLSGDADVAIDGSVALAGSGARSLRGQSGTIRNMRLLAGDASISLSGSFAIDEQGLVDAQLQLSVENPRELSALIAETLPEFAGQIETAFSGMAALGDAPSLPLTIVRSRVSIAFLDLGEIPPL